VERWKPDSEVARIEQKILLVRGVRDIVDADLAPLYGPSYGHADIVRFLRDRKVFARSARGAQ
jgi:hypothetical protein